MSHSKIMILVAGCQFTCIVIGYFHPQFACFIHIHLKPCLITNKDKECDGTMWMIRKKSNSRSS